jgi:hypothetical protein
LRVAQASAKDPPGHACKHAFPSARRHYPEESVVRRSFRVAFVVSAVSLPLFVTACSHADPAQRAVEAPSVVAPPPSASRAPEPDSSPALVLPSRSGTNTVSAAPAAGGCAGRQLAADFRLGNPGNGGQARSGAVGLRNVSGAGCTLVGYPGLQLVGRGNDPISTYTVHGGGPGRVLVLAPGRTAWAVLSWTTAPASDEPSSEPCQPAAAQLAVNPPNDQTQLYAAFGGGSVCDHGRMTINPFAGVT